MVRLVGNSDPSVSTHLKAYIQQGDLTVVGVIQEGSVKNLSAQWAAPFEGDTVGSKLERVGGIIQSQTETTSVTSLQSTQVWTGNLPPVLNLTLLFYALRDAKGEVHDALLALEQMKAPEVNGISPVGGLGEGMLGRRPNGVVANIGRNAIYKDCVITEVGEPLQGPKTQDGYLAVAEVDVTIEGIRMLNRSEIPGTFR